MSVLTDRTDTLGRNHGWGRHCNHCGLTIILWGDCAEMNHDDDAVGHTWGECDGRKYDCDPPTCGECDDCRHYCES